MPVVVALSAGDAGQRAGLVYGADLIGDCLGAVLAAVAWAPLLGLPAACWTVAVWLLAGVVGMVE